MSLILTTKLYIPTPRPELVPRPRLIETLNQGLRCKLSLISAPAGFGKTTVVGEWIRHNIERTTINNDTTVHSPPPSHSYNFAWLSLDEADNDPLRFLTYFIASLQQVQPDAGQLTQGLLQAPNRPSLETLMTSLINEVVALTDKIVLVLDDYHVIENTLIDEALTFLLNHLPPQLHLIIISRIDPSLPLARLRARGQLTELRTDDLRFTTAEAATFLNSVTNLTFTSEHIAALERRTEGWIAGLQLAALSISKTDNVANFIADFTGSHRYIIDYLTDEVLDQQPPDVREFLLQTSILRRFCASLCDAVTTCLPQTPFSPPSISQSPILQGRTGSQTMEVSDDSTPSQPPSARGRSQNFPPSGGENLVEPKLSAPDPQSPISNLQPPVSNLQSPTPTPQSPIPNLQSPTAPPPSSQNILEHLEAANLFIIPLDDQRLWYRYHHLFADLLQQRLAQMMASNGGLAALHNRASEWFEAQTTTLGKIELIDEALHHAYQAKDFERTARLVVTYSRPIIMRGEISIVKGWLEALPDELIRDNPSLCLVQAWLYFFSQQLDLMEPYLQRIEQISELQTASESPEKLGLLGEITGLRAWAARNRGDLQQAIHLSKQALDYLPEERYFERGMNHIFLGSALEGSGKLKQAAQILEAGIPLCQAAGNILAAMGATSYLANLQILQGQLRRAKDILQQALDQATAANRQNIPATAQLYSSLAHILYEQNNLPQAQIMLEQALELVKHGLSAWPIFGENYLLLSQLKLANGDLDGAWQALQKFEAAMVKWDSSQFTTELLAYRATILLRLGDIETALRWQQTLDLFPDDELTYANEVEMLVLARLLIARDDRSLLMQAINLLARLSETTAAAGRLGPTIEILVLQAVAYTLANKTSEAVTALEQALTLAEPEGYVRVFVDEGPILRPLLGEIMARNGESSYINQLLTALPSIDAQPTSTPADKPPQRHSPPLQTLIEPLSERELEVLGLVAAGLSNRDIAEKLVLATSTVKRHISNIYGKLGVNSRTQAIAKAQELNLL